MDRVTSLPGSSVGKKILMAVTGLVLVLFVLGHLFGNLKVFFGPEKFNAYAEGLRTLGAPIFGHGQFLWIARIALLACLGVHLWSAWATTRQSWAARKLRYAKNDDLSFSYASRTMRWGGVILLAFVAYHLMHLTWGNVHPDFDPGDPYHNFVEGFRRWPAALAYIVAMVPLALHLYHGVWSATQTLALTNARVEPYRRPFAAAVAILIGAGNISLPLAVLAGVVK
jgi:succinate dehydrogenase / fumarate reductase cytochrome b subunit